MDQRINHDIFGAADFQTNPSLEFVLENWWPAKLLGKNQRSGIERELGGSFEAQPANQIEISIRIDTSVINRNEL